MLISHSAVVMEPLMIEMDNTVDLAVVEVVEVRQAILCGQQVVWASPVRAITLVGGRVRGVSCTHIELPLGVVVDMVHQVLVV
jgi:hypothetical protein